MGLLKVLFLIMIMFYTLFSQNYYNNNSNTGMLDELLSYAEVGNLEGVKRIISDPNSQNILNLANFQGNTALMLASREGHEDIVLLLLSQNVNVNLTSASGKTALIYATQSGYINIVSYLIARNAYIDTQVNNGTTALLQAAGKGYESIVRMLIESGADVNLSGIYDEGSSAVYQFYPDMTPLMIASYNNQDSIVRLLLREKAQVNYINEYGATALLYAVGQKNTDIALMLLEGGSDVNIAGIFKSYANISPLALASLNSLDDLISPLLIAKAQVNFKMKDGRTALMWAAISGDTVIIDKLLNFNANINIQDADGKTALIHAAQSSHINAVEVLVDAKAFINTECLVSKCRLSLAGFIASFANNS